MPALVRLVTVQPAYVPPRQVALESVGDLRKVVPDFERNGLSATSEACAVLRSRELGRYDPVRRPAGVKAVAGVRADVVRLLGWPSGAYAPGAYPFPISSLR